MQLSDKKRKTQSLKKFPTARPNHTANILPAHSNSMSAAHHKSMDKKSGKDA